MGACVLNLAQSGNTFKTVCGVDPYAQSSDVPVYKSFSEVKEKIDVIVDFSSPSALKGLTDWAIANGVPAVLASTGYSESDIKRIEETAKHIAVFRTGNLSLGVNLVQQLIKRAAEVLGESFDVEIIERHHNLKADAPSGTALMLADSVNRAYGNGKPEIYGRHGITGKRGNEIAIHAVRGGTIVGEHEVMFAGEDEIITVSHSARSKRVFASGALKAAQWLAGKPAGLYDMNDLLKNI